MPAGSQKAPGIKPGIGFIPILLLNKNSPISISVHFLMHNIEEVVPKVLTQLVLLQHRNSKGSH